MFTYDSTVSTNILVILNVCELCVLIVNCCAMVSCAVAVKYNYGLNRTHRLVSGALCSVPLPASRNVGRWRPSTPRHTETAFRAPQTGMRHLSTVNVSAETAAPAAGEAGSYICCRQVTLSYSAEGEPTKANEVGRRSPAARHFACGALAPSGIVCMTTAYAHRSVNAQRGASLSAVQFFMSCMQEAIRVAGFIAFTFMK